LITTLIADDEVYARERLRDMLDRFGLFDIIAEACDGNEAIGFIITRKPRVAFLDINMPGISVFRSIPSLQNPPIIIFQTAHSEHAAEAFDINALDYLLKPIRFERLEKTVAKIGERLVAPVSGRMKSAGTAPPPAGQVTVTVNGKTRVIATKEIIRISFENGFCYIYTAKEKLASDKFLNYFEEKLSGGRFFRTSRNDLINLDDISMIHKLLPGMYTIELKSGMQVELSRRKAQELRTIIDF
jgi:DNA-binding LytR/AlgR family response regulator